MQIREIFSTVVTVRTINSMLIIHFTRYYNSAKIKNNKKRKKEKKPEKKRNKERREKNNNCLIRQKAIYVEGPSMIHVVYNYLMIDIQLRVVSLQ